MLLAFEEIRLCGAGSPRVSRRLRAALDDLEEIAPPERRRVLKEQRARLDASVRDAVNQEPDVRLALLPDRLGLGVDAT